jgi:hypothetical protein
MVDAVRTDGEVKFNFYTYNPAGRDVIIPVWAVDMDAAWAKFDKLYGADTPVDDVVQEKS